MKKQCRRKVWPLLNPVTHAIQGAAITDTASLNKLRMAELSAIEAFAKGRATPHDWRAIADMLNVSESLCGMGVGPEALETCLKAQEALGNVHAHGTTKASRCCSPARNCRPCGTPTNTQTYSGQA